MTVFLALYFLLILISYIFIYFEKNIKITPSFYSILLCFLISLLMAFRPMSVNDTAGYYELWNSLSDYKLTEVGVLGTFGDSQIENFFCLFMLLFQKLGFSFRFFLFFVSYLIIKLIVQGTRNIMVYLNRKVQIIESQVIFFYLI